MKYNNLSADNSHVEWAMIGNDLCNVYRQRVTVKDRNAVERLVETTCLRTGVSVYELMGKSREMRITKARQIAAFILRRYGLTCAQASAVLGIDQSCVSHFYKRCAVTYAQSQMYASIVRSIEKEAQMPVGVV